MPKRRKTKKRKAIENERYEIFVHEWEADCHFGINMIRNDPDDFWEHSGLILSGNIISPVLNNALQALIHIMESPQLNDHWKREARDKPPVAIGFMEIPRGVTTLTMNCWVPSRFFKNIPIFVSSGKIKYVSIFGTKLKWRRGEILDISLRTHPTEE